MKKIAGNPLFLIQFAADMLSNFGDVLYALAMMNYVLTVPDTELALGLVTLSETVPIFAGLFIGMWADRTQHKLSAIAFTGIFRTVLYLFVGCLMGLTPSLWIVLVVAICNFLSDSAGQYENGLNLPIGLRIVAKEDREAAMAFRMSLGAFLRIGFQAASAILVGLFSYQHLAFINAGTFLASLGIFLVIRPSLATLLEKEPIQQVVAPVPYKGLMGTTKGTLKEAYQAIKGIPVLKSSIVLIVCLNAIFTALSPLLLLTIKENQAFVLVNPATTLSTVSILATVGMIGGSILATSLFQRVNLVTLIRFATLLPLVLFLAFYLQHIYLLLVTVFVSTLFLGVFNPKMNALVLNTLPEDKLATIDGGISTVCQLGMVVGQGVLAILMVILSSQMISLLFFLLSLLLLVYTIIMSRKNGDEM